MEQKKKKKCSYQHEISWLRAASRWWKGQLKSWPRTEMKGGWFVVFARDGHISSSSNPVKFATSSLKSIEDVSWYYGGIVISSNTPNYEFTMSPSFLWHYAASRCPSTRPSPGLILCPMRSSTGGLASWTSSKPSLSTVFIGSVMSCNNLMTTLPKSSTSSNPLSADWQWSCNGLHSCCQDLQQINLALDVLMLYQDWELEGHSRFHELNTFLAGDLTAVSFS